MNIHEILDNALASLVYNGRKIPFYSDFAVDDNNTHIIYSYYANALYRGDGTLYAKRYYITINVFSTNNEDMLYDIILKRMMSQGFIFTGELTTKVEETFPYKKRKIQEYIIDLYVKE